VLKLISHEIHVSKLVTVYNIKLAAAIMNRHVPPFSRVIAIVKQLAHEVCEGKASLLEDACLSVLGEDNVFGCQSCS